MKCLTIIAHGSAKQSLADFLLNIPEVKGFTLIDCEGHYGEDVVDPFLSNRDRVVGYVPRVRADMLLQDSNIDTVLTKLRQSGSGVAGLGEYWITTIENQGRL